MFSVMFVCYTLFMGLGRPLSLDALGQAGRRAHLLFLEGRTKWKGAPCKVPDQEELVRKEGSSPHGQGHIRDHPSPDRRNRDGGP